MKLPGEALITQDTYWLPRKETPPADELSDTRESSARTDTLLGHIRETKDEELGLKEPLVH